MRKMTFSVPEPLAAQLIRRVASRDRSRFVSEALGDAYGVLVAMKDVLDPNHILNPGVLGLSAPPW